MALVQVIDWYVAAELNETRKTLTQGGVAVGESFMNAITRVRIIVNGVSVDTNDPIPVGTIDYTTNKAASQIIFRLGRFDGTAPAEGRYPARLEIWQDSDNAVIADDAEKILYVRVFADSP